MKPFRLSNSLIGLKLDYLWGMCFCVAEMTPYIHNDQPTFFASLCRSLAVRSIASA